MPNQASQPTVSRHNPEPLAKKASASSHHPIRSRENHLKHFPPWERKKPHSLARFRHPNRSDLNKDGRYQPVLEGPYLTECRSAAGLARKNCAYFDRFPKKAHTDERALLRRVQTRISGPSLAVDRAKTHRIHNGAATTANSIPYSVESSFSRLSRSHYLYLLLTTAALCCR